MASLRNVPRFFGFRYWGADQTSPIRSYRPIRETSVALDRALWGDLPSGYRLTSLVLHILTALGVYLIVRDILPRRPIAAMLAATVYAVHPSQVETVATVEDRAEILAAYFVLATIWFWARALRSGDRRRLAWHATAVCTFVLAMASKITAAALPLALIPLACCLPRVQQDRPSGRPAQSPAWPWTDRFVCVSVLSFFVTAALFSAAGLLMVRRDPRSLERLSLLPFVWRPALAVAALQAYLRMALVPVQRGVDVMFRVPGPPLAAWYAALAGWVLLSAAWVASRRLPLRAASVALAWSLAFLLPALICPGAADRAVAEPRLYLPLVGLSVCVAAAAAESRQRRALIVAGILVYSGLTCRRALVRTNSRTLWFNSVLDSPRNARIHNRLGMAYQGAGASDLAKRQLAIAFRLDAGDPNNPAGRNLARICRAHPALGCPASWLERHLLFRPQDGDAWLDLAHVRLMQHDTEGAEQALRCALDVHPPKLEAHNDLAAVYAGQGDFHNAESTLRKGLRIQPLNANLWANLGHVARQLGRHAEALTLCAKAASIDPMNALAQLRLGEVLCDMGRYRAAMEAVSASLQRDPSNRQARSLLQRLDEALASTQN